MVATLLILTSIACGLVSASAEDTATSRFHAHLESNGISLRADERAARLAIFLTNEAFVKQHNADPETTATLALNQFAHLTTDEFAAAVGLSATSSNAWRRRDPVSATSSTVLEEAKEDLPSSLDWRTAGAVTPVKQQSDCGSCWAFSATGAMEGAWKLKNNTLVSFSEQQLMDCSNGYGDNNGCGGGHMDDAFHYVRDAGGLASEASYPYTAKSDPFGPCHFKGGVPGFKLQSWQDIQANNEDALQRAVATHGPVSVAIHAMSPVFQHYKSGVLTAECHANETDHSVLLVGYGQSSSSNSSNSSNSSALPYWLVKNSWGAEWGEAGYFKLGKGAEYNDGAGQCGLCQYPSIPLLA